MVAGERREKQDSIQMAGGAGEKQGGQEGGAAGGAGEKQGVQEKGEIQMVDSFFPPPLQANS